MVYLNAKQATKHNQGFYQSKYQDVENIEVNLSTQEYYVNQIMALAEVELENFNKFNELLNDIEIYDLVNTNYQAAHDDRDITKIFILPLIVLIIFVSLIILFNLYSSYYLYIKKNS